MSVVGFTVPSDAGESADGRRRPSQVSFSGGSDIGAGFGAGGGSTPSRSKRNQWRDVLASIRTQREALVESLCPVSDSSRKSAAEQADDKFAGDGEEPDARAPGTVSEYPPWNGSGVAAALDLEGAPAAHETKDSAQHHRRLITARRPHSMRNRALAAIALALSTLISEKSLPQPNNNNNNNGASSETLRLPVALQQQQAEDFAPFTVEDVTMTGGVPLELLSQNMLTIFEAQDILNRCIAAAPELTGRFEVRAALASVLLVDTEDDWGPAFEVAPRRLAYKASELEEALSDVLRRRGVALVFFDKKALIEGMKCEDLGEDEDDNNDVLNAPINDPSGASSGSGFDSHAAASGTYLFNGSFTGKMGATGGAPVAMQALRTRRTDLREADCGFVLGPTKQLESVLLAIPSYNPDKDDLELHLTEVTATALLDAMAMRNAATGRPRGFLAVLPLNSGTATGGAAAGTGSTVASSAGADSSEKDSHSEGGGGGSPASKSNDVPFDTAMVGSAGPLISALEVVASNIVVTAENLFPAFVGLAQNGTLIAGADTSNNGRRIQLVHVEDGFATHVTAAAIGVATITGTLSSGLPINDIVTTVSMSGEHMMHDADNTLGVHDIYAYLLQYATRKQPEQKLDVEWCPVVQMIHRANAAATVSVEQLRETLLKVRDSNSAKNGAAGAADVCMLVKLRIDIAVGTHGNSPGGAGGGTRWLVVAGFDDDNSQAVLLDPSPRRFGLFWSVSVEQLHRALTGHGYIVLAARSGSSGQATAADYPVYRPETHSIMLQAGTSYDSPDAVLPAHSQVPPVPVARAPLSLAPCALSRVSGLNVSFSQFLRMIPQPVAYGYTEDISLAHFAHVLRMYCHEAALPVRMTLVHLSVDHSGARTVDINEFRDRLIHAAAHPKHAVVVNFSVRAFSNTVRQDRGGIAGTGSFALLLGFIPADGKLSRYDRVLLQDASDPHQQQQVFSVELNELYEACCQVCSASRRTMGFIDLRYFSAEEEERGRAMAPSMFSADSFASLAVSGNESLPVLAPRPAAAAVAAASNSHNEPSSGVGSGNNISVAMEGMLDSRVWEVVALPHHPDIPRHMFRTPGIPALTAAAHALATLGIPACTERLIVEASFRGTARSTQYDRLPTALQAKPAPLDVIRGLLSTFLESKTSNSGIVLAPPEISFYAALAAVAKHPKSVRIVVQYDCRSVHATIRKFVSAGVVSAVSGGPGASTMIRVLEAEIASFMDAWVCPAGQLVETFQRQSASGCIVLYDSKQVPTSAFVEPTEEQKKYDGKTAAGGSAGESSGSGMGGPTSSMPRANVVSPPLSPARPHQQGGGGGGAGAAPQKMLPYSLKPKK